MGWVARIDAVGFYHPDVQDLMDSPEDWEDVSEETPCIVVVLEMSATSASRDLASALGVNVNDPTTYCVTLKNVDWAGFEDALSLNGLSAAPNQHALERLSKCGFAIFFRVD